MIKSMFAKSIQRPGANSSYQQLNKLEPKNGFNSATTRPHTGGMSPAKTFNEAHGSDEHGLTIPTALRNEDSFDKECAKKFDVFFIELMHSNPSVNGSCQCQDSDSQYEDSDSDVDSIVVERRRRARRTESSQKQRHRQHR
jgi:hypothetical protein